MRKRINWALAFTLMLLGGFLFVRGDLITTAASQPGLQAAQKPAAGSPLFFANPAANPADEACRLCHVDTEAIVAFPSGETLPARVDPALVDASAHGIGEQPLGCTSCHDGNRYRQPHEGIEAESIRDYQIQVSAACTRCHNQPHVTSHENLPGGETVLCTDCHGAHEVAQVDHWPAAEVTATCLACHEAGDRGRLELITAGGLFTHPVGENYCLACHSQPGPEILFADGETLSVYVNPDHLRTSVHGENNDWGEITCRNCHDQGTYPHEAIEAASPREYTLNQYQACAQCHDHNYDQALDSVHGAALEEGKLESAVCTDCHGSHNVQPPNVPRSRVSQTCRTCHSTIYDNYATSVHGDALLTQDNPDVPNCIDCHGVHTIDDPTTNLFRIRSPQLCGSCHANSALMEQYDISTQVFDTYVADFHGTTVTLFDHLDPNVETNKAVCYDCHGVHDIKAPDDPQSGIKLNLLATCQKCHPDATANFPDAWTSHFEPSLEHNPLVYLVDLFYAIIIPATVISLSFLVSTDIYRRVRTRISGRKGSES